MKKQNGFISMAVVYSFFLVFATITTLLLANYAHNRLLIREMNNDIKTELLNIGNNKLLKFNNLLVNGNMEANSNWTFSNSTNIQYSEKNFVSTKRSIVLNIPSASTTTTLSQNLTTSIIPGHKYYFRINMFAPWLTTGTTSTIQLRNLSNNATYPFSQITTFGDYRNWSLRSQILQIPSSASAGTSWRFEIVETGKIGSPIYIDDLLLLDLTATEGASSHSKSWLDENIPYFDGEGLFNSVIDNNYLSSDIKIIVRVNGVNQSAFPTKNSGYTFKSYECQNGTTGTWNATTWQMRFEFTGSDQCIINFG